MILLPSRTAMLSLYMFISMPYTIARAICMHDYDMLSHSHGGTVTMTYEAPSGRELNTDKIKVFPSSQADHSAHHSPVAERILYLPRTILHGLHTDEGESSRSRDVYVPEWTIPQRSRVDSPMWCRELMVHLAHLTAQEESNALTNPIALERAWFNLARWAMAQTDILERFKNLQDDYDMLIETHAECSETVQKDQALQIKELEAELAKKDSPLVYAERISAERAEENEKLITQLGRTEMERFDCVCKLLPTVVGLLLQSH
uniref:Uncharacterized protein n=1 Tax=Tanacetum cinerariifolium TaxID=118510 RepID=A0A6L2M4C0_TANCI|nr:hypothetical protein [Tanacetum cinerariifolium]